jgi:hypothetical protein
VWQRIAIQPKFMNARAVCRDLSIGVAVENEKRRLPGEFEGTETRPWQPLDSDGPVCSLEWGGF